MSVQNKMPVSTPIESDKTQKTLKNKSDNIISKSQKKSSINCKFYATDIFSEVKNLLNIMRVVEYYGVSLNSKGFALCPFHQENTPSFKVYDDSFYCFGCGESGTVIDFVMKYFRLTNIEAVKKLNDDFSLKLPIGGSSGAAMSRSLQDDKNLIESFKEWEKRAYRTVSKYFKLLRFYGEQIYVHENEEFNKYLPEVDNILFVETLLDLMIENTSDFAAQVEFYKDFGEAVKWIEQKLHV